MTTQANRTWPELPYKGLSFYGPEDAPLFAGRDNDITRCAYALGDPATRCLILQGATGCGKSSFLRAGLIPYLVSEDVGFDFLKEDKVKALFVRSTDKPLVELAKTVYDFAGRDMRYTTPKGEERLLGLPGVLAGYAQADFIAEAGNSPRLLIDVLGKIAAKLRRTLVLIIDQAEELFTLDVGGGGDHHRETFSEFMTLFSRSEFAIKLLVALRTDYFGWLFSSILQAEVDQPHVKYYLLRDLTRGQLIDAITLPTSEDAVEGYGSPRSHYRFRYEEGLPEKIVDELLSKKLTGGVLPIMQVVCNTLSQMVKRGSPEGTEWVITEEDYRSLGRIEGQIEAHLDQVLTALCRGEGVAEANIPAEIEGWKGVLSGLAKLEVDGRVTTRLEAEDDLAGAACGAKCKLNPRTVLEYLSDDEVRILRRVDLAQVEADRCTRHYSLGHDAIGLTLERWKAARKEKERGLLEREAHAVKASQKLGQRIIERFGFYVGRFSLHTKIVDLEGTCNSYWHWEGVRVTRKGVKITSIPGRMLYTNPDSRILTYPKLTTRQFDGPIHLNVFNKTDKACEYEVTIPEASALAQGKVLSYGYETVIYKGFFMTREDFEENSTDPFKMEYSAYEVTTPVGELELFIAFPDGYKVEASYAVFSGADFSERFAHGEEVQRISETQGFMTRDNWAQLRVDAPLLGFTYLICWGPPPLNSLDFSG